MAPVMMPQELLLLKRMADKIWTVKPEAYIILEHFAPDQEEKELASLWHDALGKYKL